MPGDYSRKTFDSRKHYVGVLEQQGRVRLDSDANEELDIRLHLAETQATDVIGGCAVPKNNAGFGLSTSPDASDLLLSPGRLYVEGRLCELEAEAIAAELQRGNSDRVVLPSLYADGRLWSADQWVSIAAGAQTRTVRVVSVAAQERTLTVSGLPGGFPSGAVHIRRATSYLTQPHYPAVGTSVSSPPASPPSSPPSGNALQLSDGDYVAYLQVWDREVTALEDPRIREVALGGPDTTTRLQNIWQVRLFGLPASSPAARATCDDRVPAWVQSVARPTGRLNVRTVVPSPPANPCELPPGTGYRRLENQLYRVEVHAGGDRAGATFKWSRDNGTAVTSIISVSGTRIVVADTGKDRFLSFEGLQWAEIYDDESELSNDPRPLVEIQSVNPDTREIVVNTSLAALESRTGLRLRRWDQRGGTAGVNGVSMPAGWIELEDGVQVRFSAGTYRSGDYWLIPARVGRDVEWPPYEVPNLNPIEQPPHGIRRRYCRLAMLHVDNGQIRVEDCRDTFPPLSGICAEDVCFDNTHCDFEGAENVQDALDRLCEARDLRFHNKHLHGKGVVCGLQVRCGPDANRPRRHVTVRPGYAIDCDGRDLVLERPESLDVIEMLGPGSPPASPPSGEREVRLRIQLGRDNRPAFTLDPAPARRNPLTEALEGTLLRDFTRRCVQPVLNAFREPPSPGGARSPVSPATRRVSALTTLYSPLIVTGSLASAASPQPFLSRQDHDTLVELYNRLRAALRSSTHCGLLDNARPLPNYPFSQSGSLTLYGTGFHTRAVVSADGRRSYTFGSDNTILVYDSERGEAIAREAFPGAENVRVTAAAVSASGRRLYAAADIGGIDTAFATAEITDTGLTWRPATVICGVRITSMAVSTTAAERVYAIGLGRGLYEINPDNPDPKPQPKVAFRASGDLAVFPEQNLAYATAASGEDASRYDQVLRLPLTGDANPYVYQLRSGQTSFAGADGLGLAVQSRSSARLMVTVDGAGRNTGEKQVLLFDALETDRARDPDVASLGDNSRVSLAYNRTTKSAMATLESSSAIAFFDPENGRLAPASYPAGVSPRAIVAEPSGRNVYVMNTGSNALARIPATELQPAGVPSPQQLAEYRARMAEAFVDLLAAAAQHIKDCFCDLLLVSCPQCEEDDRLYLASIHIRDGEVHNVCNFSERKHVHTFPKLFYWLSIVPVLPLLKLAVERVCCLLLPELAAGYQAPRPQTPGPASPPAGGFTMNTLARAVAALPTLNLDTTRRRLAALARNVPTTLSDFLEDRSEPVRTRPELAQSDIADLPVESARERLRASGITDVAVERYDPRRAGGNLIDIAAAPTRLRAGDRVTLVAHNGFVRYVRINRGAPAAPAGGALEDEVTRLKADLGAAQERFDAEMQAARQQFETDLNEARRTFDTDLDGARKQLGEEIASRDRRIAQLEVTAKTSEEHSTLLRQLREEVDSLKSRRSKGGG
jgi:DNA-binding beta-propeller fold protein YncE